MIASIRCPHCADIFEVPPSFLGRDVTCLTCSKPFIASTNALDRLSTMPRTTAAARSPRVLASFLNGSSRLRRAQLSQPRRSASTCTASLLLRARA